MSPRRKKPYKVDLTNIEGGGDFPCPKCKTMISPDDESEEVYTIVETFIGDEDNLESMIIRCNDCKSTINLEGFSALLEEEETRSNISDPLPESRPGFRTHHTVSFDGQQIGNIVVEYAGKDDVKAFKKVRKLRAGDAFKGIVTIEGPTELTKADLKEIAKVVRRKFKGLTNHDIYMLELKDGRRSILGRASNL